MLYDSRVNFEEIRKAMSASQYGRDCRKTGLKAMTHNFAAGACLTGALWLWIGASDELWAMLLLGTFVVLSVSGISAILAHEKCCQLYDREYFLRCLKQSESFADLGASGLPDLQHFHVTKRSDSQNTQNNLTYHEFTLR